MNVIAFYSQKEKWGEFSNFYPSPIIVDGIEYPTSEHYYQCEKFSDSEYREIIRTHVSPAKAKILAGQRVQFGYKWKTDLNPIIQKYRYVSIKKDWNKICDNVMRKAVYQKFTQHPKLKKLLLSTGDKLLVEHTSYDNYWADGGVLPTSTARESGKNMLGKILMEVRWILANEGCFHKNPYTFTKCPSKNTIIVDRNALVYKNISFPEMSEEDIVECVIFAIGLKKKIYFTTKNFQLTNAIMEKLYG